MLKEKTIPYSPSWLDENLREDNDRDLKKEIEFSTPEGMAKLIRHCAALSNFGGGSLIVGVESDKKTGKWNVIGVDPSKIHVEYDSTKIMQKINKHCSPPIHLTTTVIDYNGKLVLAIGVAGADKSPVLIKNKLTDSTGKILIREGSLFIRDQSASVEATTETQVRRILDNLIYQEVQIQVAQVRHSLTLMGILPSEADRRNASISKFERSAKEWLLGQSQISETEGRREFFLYPVDAIAKVDLQKIKSIKIESNSWPFPFYAENGPKAINTKINGGYAHAFPGWGGFQLIDEGFFFSLEGLWEDSRFEFGVKQFADAIGVMTTQISISLCLLYLKEILPLIKYEGKWRLVHRMVNIKNRKLIVDDPSRTSFMTERRCHEDEVTVTTGFSTAELLQNIDEITLELCIDVYQMFNWNNPPVAQIKRDIENFRGGVQVLNSVVFQI